MKKQFKLDKNPKNNLTNKITIVEQTHDEAIAELTAWGKNQKKLGFKISTHKDLDKYVHKKNKNQ